MCDINILSVHIIKGRSAVRCCTIPRCLFGFCLIFPRVSDYLEKGTETELGVKVHLYTFVHYSCEFACASSDSFSAGFVYYTLRGFTLKHKHEYITNYLSSPRGKFVNASAEICERVACVVFSLLFFCCRRSFRRFAVWCL